MNGSCRTEIARQKGTDTYLPRVTTTTYGLHSFRYAATQVWNMLPDDIRTSESLIAFKRAIQDITAQIICVY